MAAGVSGGRPVVAAMGAALVLTGAVAAYATVTALRLQDEVGALRATVSGTDAPAAADGSAAGAAAAAAGAGAGTPRPDSLAGRVAALDATVRAHERTIEDLSSIVAGLAGMTDKDLAGLEIGADGEASGPAAAKLRAFLKSERLKERRETYERMAAKIDSVVAEKHARFVEEKGLSPDKDKALAELEASVHERAHTIAESVLTGEKMWWEIRPEIRGLFDDTMGRLDAVLGAEDANAYLDRLAEDFPMLNRWRRGDSPWSDGPRPPGSGAPAAPAE